MRAPLQILMALYSLSCDLDAIALTQLDKDRSDTVYGTMQWNDSNFVPIAEAIDRMFVSLGWKSREVEGYFRAGIQR